MHTHVKITGAKYDIVALTFPVRILIEHCSAILIKCFVGNTISMRVLDSI